MEKKYFPVLVSKHGEFGALDKLAQEVKDEISPVIRILPTPPRKEAKEGKQPKDPTDSLIKVANFLVPKWSFEGNQILLDFSLYGAINQTKLISFFNTLLNANCNFIPVIEPQSSKALLKIVKQLHEKRGNKVCIKLTNENDGFLNTENVITSLMRQLSLDVAATLILVDIGYCQDSNYNILAATANETIEKIRNLGLNEIVLASGSFPPDLGRVNPAGQRHLLMRYEWEIWKTLKLKFMEEIKYADFCTKNPIYEDIGFAGSISLKYSSKNNFIIYKGKLARDHRFGLGQYISHSKQLIQHQEYKGEQFSFGDARIFEYSRLSPGRDKPGSSTTWLEISINHHITLLHGLL